MSERTMQYLIIGLSVLWVITFCRTKLGKKCVKFVRWTVAEAIFFGLWCLPRDKSLVAFGSDFGFGGNPKYLYLEMRKRPGYRCVWIAKNKDVYESMKRQGYDVCMIDSWAGRRVMLRAATLIHSHSIKEDFNYLLVGGATSVNTWHGVGLKRSWYRNINAFSGKWLMAEPSLKRSYNLLWARTNMARENYVIGTSEEVDSYYPVTYNVPADHVLNLGQARNDVFYEYASEEETLPECFKNGKVIVYMPTHRGYGARRGRQEKVGMQVDYGKLSKVLAKYGYTMVIKQHSFNTDTKTTKDDYPNIIDVSRFNYEIDTQLILKHTDILISDYSSVYTDFLLLDRPIIFYCYDLEDYLSRWDTNFDYDYVTPGPRAFYSDQLIERIEQLLQGHDEYEAERQRVKRVFYSPENQCPVAAKQVDYIINNIIKR